MDGKVGKNKRSYHNKMMDRGPIKVSQKQLWQDLNTMWDLERK